MYNKKIPIDISCGFRIAIEVMGGKWKPYIIYELPDGPKGKVKACFMLRRSLTSHELASAKVQKIPQIIATSP